MDTVILGIDPGLATGMALVRICGHPMPGDGALSGVNRGTVELLEVAHVRAHSLAANAIKADEMMTDWEPDMVVLEDFRLFPDRRHSPKREDIAPVYVIAGLEVLWEQRGTLTDKVPVEVRQMPGEKDAITDVWLKKVGLWRTPARGIVDGKSGDGPHAMDALRHCVLLARKQRWL